MQYGRRGLPLLMCACLGLGCYASHPVEVLDAGPCGSDALPGDPPWHGTDVRAWVRTRGAGAERRYQAVLFDSIDPGSVTCNPNVVVVEATPSATLETKVGRFVDGGATLRLTRRYYFDPQPGLDPASRRGPVQEDIDERSTVERQIDGDTLTFTVDGTAREYTRLSSRIATIDRTSAAGAHEVAGLLYLAMLSTWSRIPGLWTGDIASQLADPVHVDCGLRGGVDAEATPGRDPFVTMTYDGCFDFEEISLANPYLLGGDVTGPANLSGSLTFTLVSNPADPLSSIVGTLFLDDLETTDMLISGGSANLRIGAAVFPIDASSFQALDLDRLFQ